MLFAEGESGPELYIIQKGSIRITKIVNDNEVLLGLTQGWRYIWRNGTIGR